MITGNYIKHQEELLAAAMPNEQAVINTFLSLKKGGMVDFIPMSETLFGQRNGLLKIVKSIPICRTVKQIRIYVTRTNIFQKAIDSHAPS